MKEEHGLDVFFGGCPVCKELCCCNNKSVFCHRKNHCYRKCPATKTNGKQSCAAVKEDSDSEQYHEEHASIPKPENGQYGIFDLLAAVADMDKSQALGKNGKSAAGGAAGSSSSSGPRKKAKVAKDSALGGKDIYPSNMLLCEPTSYSQYFSSSVPESVGNMQILNSKGGLAGDSGVDGYTFNNNTMGIIRGGMNGMSGVADAITLMGQQNQQQKQKFNVGMDKINLMATTDPLLSTLGSSISVPAGASSGSSSSSVLPTSSSSSAALANAYNRLPSIDSNPFASAAVRDTQPTATFDQALLDSMRNLQDPYSMSRPLPSVPRSLPAQSAAAAASSASAVAAGARSTVSAATAAEKKPTVSAAALEPMNLLALVSSFTSSLDKSTHPVPAEHLLLGASSVAAAGTGALQGSTDAEAKN
jgi:hypothetical protein